MSQAHVEDADSEVFQISRLCFEIFMMNEDGKKLMEIMVEKFLYSTLIDPRDPVAPDLGMYWNGYTDCIKFLRSSALEHKKRIVANERN